MHATRCSVTAYIHMRSVRSLRSTFVPEGTEHQGGRIAATVAAVAFWGSNKRLLQKPTHLPDLRTPIPLYEVQQDPEKTGEVKKVFGNRVWQLARLDVEAMHR